MSGVPAPRSSPTEVLVEMGRLKALSDGVVAFALTLLVLDIRLPSGVATADLGSSLLALGPELLIYLLSFAIIGSAWGSHQRMLGQISRGDGLLVWFTLLSLLPITLLPACASLLGDFPNQFLAVAVFAADALAIQLTAYWLWRHASRQGLIDQSLDRRVVEGIGRRHVVNALGFGLSIPLAFVAPALAYALWIAVFALVFTTDWVSWQQAIRTTKEAIPLDGATQARLQVWHNAARLHIDAIESDSVLLDGVFGGGVERTVSNERGGADIDLKLPRVAGLLDPRYPWAWGRFSPDWDLGLNDGIPVSLRIETIGGTADLDLVGRPAHRARPPRRRERGRCQPSRRCRPASRRGGVQGCRRDDPNPGRRRRVDPQRGGHPRARARHRSFPDRRLRTRVPIRGLRHSPQPGRPHRRVGRRRDQDRLGVPRVSQPSDPVGAQPIGGTRTSAPGAEPVRVLRLAMRIAVTMLANGAQTEDVESSIGQLARAFDVDGVQAAVSFSMISISRYTGHDEPPTTLLHLVRDRSTDFTRLAAVSEIVRRIHDGGLDVEAAEAELDDLDSARSSYAQGVRFVAPGLSAAGTTLMFGGDLLEALATLGIGLVVQPGLAALAGSSLPPFFRLGIGAAGSAILVALLVALGLDISGGLVLTGSLLRFLPGYALVSGFRDLIDGSVVSGTARLAEAVLLAAGVAGGTALSLAVASSAGIAMQITTVGQADWSLTISVAASLVAVAAYAVQLGVPSRAVAQAAAVGAIGWLLVRATTAQFGLLDVSIATLAATVVIGILGRLLAGSRGAPAAIWVVPAILPLLPGLQLVQAMLAETDAARISGLAAAAGTAFVIGTGVAIGDILVQVIRGVRDRVVAPAVGKVAEGVEVLVVVPVGRAVERARHVEVVASSDAGPVPKMDAESADPVRRRENE